MIRNETLTTQSLSDWPVFTHTIVLTEDKLVLDTTYMNGSKEPLQIMLVVPLQDMKTKTGKKAAQNLTLHSLFGDIFDPVLPDSSDYVSTK